MRRIPTVLLLSLVSVLWIGTLGPPDTLDRSPAAPALGTEPSDHLPVPRFVRWGHSPSPAPLAKAASVPAAPDPDWLAGVERGIAAREYQASVNHRGLQTPNRAQNLRTYFEPSGIRVMDRTAPGEPELARIRLSAFGREGALAEAGDARVSHESARIELARDGLVEWYENSPAGLEQGFTLAARPAGEGPLVLELHVDGARVSLEGDEATFASTDAHRSLQYAKLAAFDANGTALAAHLETCDDGLRIVTDDRDAAYPVTIDPLITNVYDTQLGVFQNLAQLGLGLTGAGDVNGDGYADVLIGSPEWDSGQNREGGAFLFLGGAIGIASNGAPAATFQSNLADGFLGRSMTAGDFNGDGYSDVAIGAYAYSSVGAVFVFSGGPSGIGNGSPANASATVIADETFSNFGLSVACAGDVNGDGYEDLVVGAQDYGSLNAGAAFIFAGSSTGIASVSAASATTRLVSGQGSAGFGATVAGAGDVNGDGFSDVLIGSYQYDLGQSNEGAVFIYHGGASGIAHGGPLTATHTLQSNVVGIQFGYAVAGVGDVNGDGYSDIAVGPVSFTDGSTNEGAVWVFHGGGGGIGNGSLANAAIEIQGNQASAFLGSKGEVAGAGDVNGDGYADMIVGADRYDSGEADEGMAFVFLGGPTGITGTTTTAFARLQVNQISARLGQSVAGAGDINGDGFADVVVGANLWDGATADEGAGFIYLGGARGMSNGTFLTANALIESNQSLISSGLYPELGKSVASAGDVNGDGIADIIVGSPGYDLGERDEGAAFVFLGGAFANGTPANAHATLQSNTIDGLFGHSVAGAGDVNDDGYADVIVGAPGIPGGGEVYVFMGSATGVANADRATAASVITSGHSGTELGCSVAGAGDVNGDGFADVVMGAEQHAGGMGGVFVFLGSATGVPSGDVLTAATQLVASVPSTKFGHSVAGAGDVNGDGFADIVVGAPYYSGGGAGDGLVFVFNGSASGIVGTDPLNDADAVLDGIQNNAHMGISVAGAGDINNDGYGDVIAGADGYGTSAQGAAFVWLGGVNGIPNTSSGQAHVRFLGALANGYFGASVACAGDLNGDGCSDMIVGQPDPVNFLGQNNIANVYMGSRTMLPVPVPTPARATLAGLQGGLFGWSVAGVGDQDGDGFADVIVGAPAFDWSENNEGIAGLFNGGSVQLGRPQRVTQLTGGGAGRIVQSWGKTYDADGFRAGAVMVDADGRKRVKLEVENCPNGVAFGSGSCTKTKSALWLDTGFSPNGLSVTGLLSSVPGGLRRWRVRTLVAPFHVTEPGIAEPPNPSHGPWRRVQAQVAEADLRVMLGTVAVEIRHDPLSFAIERLVNPTRGRIEFTAVLSGTEPAKAELFDVAGRRWLSRDLPSASPARTEFRWEEGRNMPSGTYLLRLTQGGRVATARIVILH